MPDRRQTAWTSPVHRIAYRVCYAVLIVSGQGAARLAADFRTLGSIGGRLGVVAVVLQLPVLACWLVMRPISLAAFAVCSALAPARA
jgi:hypothetical protein